MNLLKNLLQIPEIELQLLLKQTPEPKLLLLKILMLLGMVNLWV
jgi:hypothetical protein